MNAKTTVPHNPSSAEEIRALYRGLLECWNRRDPQSLAHLFAEDGNLVGFDGSMLNGRAEMQRIFADYETGTYVGKIRGVRFLASEVGLLRAVAGMVPPGQTDLNPAVNAVQTLVAVRRDDEWRIALYQNTPARFHGRTEMAQQLTEELRELL